MSALAIPPEVAEILRDARIDGTTLRLPDRRLDRPLYAAVDRLLQALGGRWDRRAGAHVFEAPIGDAIAQALAAGEIRDRKRELQLFETPPALADRMAHLAVYRWTSAADFQPPAGGRPKRILEPSAGTGSLLAGWRRRYTYVDATEVLAIDVDADNCATLQAQGIATEIIRGDFLKHVPRPDAAAHIILMNPPFARNADIDHVQHAYANWLAPGGVLVAVMSAHFTFAEDAPSRRFRTQLETVPGWECEPLPPGSFRAAGTDVATCLVSFRKKG